RRHTRCLSDWSSDVCSSDLTLFQRPAFDPAFAGGVRTAAADLNGDGVAEAVVGTGPGGVSLVRVLDGATGSQLFAVQPFESAFRSEERRVGREGRGRAAPRR